MLAIVDLISYIWNLKLCGFDLEFEQFLHDSWSGQTHRLCDKESFPQERFVTESPHNSTPSFNQFSSLFLTSEGGLLRGHNTKLPM